MGLIRAAVLTLLCGGFAIYMAGLVVSGLRSGRVKHTDSRSYYTRESNPAAYWLLIILFSAFSALGFYVWAVTIGPMLGTLPGAQ